MALYPTASPALLTFADPPPVATLNPAGTSPFVFIGDHAGNAIPSALSGLGLSDAELARHIGWDIGVGALGALLAGTMDAVFIRQTYSRLVVDCNRQPDAPDAMPLLSDAIAVPGNRDLAAASRIARIAAVHQPYHDEITAVLARRSAAGRPTVLIALHSFTPALSGGERRPWHVGILHDRGEAGFALALLAELRRLPDLVVGDNEPYRMDAIDYTVPRQAYPRALPYAEIEIRQDLIADEAGQMRWAALLESALVKTLACFRRRACDHHP